MKHVATDWTGTNTKSVNEHADFLPKRMVEDLQRTGGQNLSEIRNSLSNAIKLEAMHQEELLSDAMYTSEIIAACLKQDEDSMAYRLAKNLLTEYAKKTSENSGLWGEDR